MAIVINQILVQVICGIQPDTAAGIEQHVEHQSARDVSARTIGADTDVIHEAVVRVVDNVAWGWADGVIWQSQP